MTKPRLRTTGNSLLLASMVVVVATAYAQTPRALLEGYAAEARTADTAFTEFSAERGRAFYFRTHRQADGDEYACASCHHQDPRREQFAHHDKIPCRACHFPDQYRGDGHFIRRQLMPLAPVANPDRFTDPVKAERWFAKNCDFVLGRPCSAVEKGDLITWLLSVEPER